MKKTILPLGQHLMIPCFIFVLLTLTACVQPAVNIEKLWFYTHSSGNLSDRDTLLTPASFISLKKDGSFTLDFETFEYGTWIKEDKTIHLKNSKNKSTDILVKNLSAKEMELTIKDFSPANFESQPARFESPAENPFSLENNRWRIAAESKESDKELKLRLLNHLKFWELYFSWGLTNELNSIDVRSTPTLIKIYGNGFALKTTDQLPIKWKQCFFDEDDCMKANEIMRKIFQDSDIAWANTDNKYKMFISAFQQLQQKIKP